jgi:amino acid adenylation domain-containing protein/non-ribosomal peptide synthase protein (TIGR01720 family)
LQKKIRNPKAKEVGALRDGDAFKDRTIPELFQLQVEKTPLSVALVFEDEELTYQQLDEKSNQLARCIRSRYQGRTGEELQPDTLIALCLERSLEMVIGILGVLKAGGAYVPIDPSHPQERINYLLDDTKTEIVITTENSVLTNSISLPQHKQLFIGLNELNYKKYDCTRLPSYNSNRDLAYVIYTSGTTGRPKGVMLEHRGVVNRIEWMQSMYSVDEEDVILQKTPYGFDVSVWELLWGNWYGAKIVLAKPDGHKDSAYLHALIKRFKVTTLHFVPSMLEVYSHFLADQKEQLNSSIYQLFCSGEALKEQVVQSTYKYASNPHFKLHNLYGPTEASIDVSFYETHPDKKVYIGKPIRNVKTYVLSGDRHLVSDGDVGELYLSGIALARGYLNNKHLTGQHFIENPFATHREKKAGFEMLYKTGDLVRWVEGEGLEYLGRGDDQVKIRGHRIEIGEIEHALSKCSEIKQNCVVVKERQSVTGMTSRYLVGYFTLNEGAHEVCEEQIVKQLRQTLPEYMVPSMFVQLNNFPLTANGKLDKNSFPEPAPNSSLTTYAAPETPTEKVVCNVWKEVLSVSRVSTNDDFFRLGGDSILCIQAASRIQKEGYDCQVRDIYKAKTVARLSTLLENKDTRASIKSEQGLLEGTFGLLPVQKWFTDRIDAGKLSNANFWNQSFMVKVPVLETSRLGEMVQELARHHDMLRVRFVKGKEWKQVYQSQIDTPEFFVLDVKNLSKEEVEQALDRWQSQLNLEKGPLFQWGYLHGYEDNSARLFFAAHHLVMDSVSWRVLTEDIKALYDGKILSKKGTSYRQWVETITRYPKQYPEERFFWLDLLKEIPDYRKVYPDPSILQSEDSVVLNTELTHSLLRIAPEAYHTEINDLLLTVLAYALQEVNGLSAQGITLEGHGREPIDPEVDHSRTIGWFTSMFPVLLKVKGTIKESIICTKETLRRIPAKGLGFGPFASGSGMGYSLKDLVPISFNYLGQFDTKKEEWQISSDSKWLDTDPNNIDFNIISVTGMVVDGCMEFNIMTRLGVASTSLLAIHFKNHLLEVLKHCVSKLEKVGISYTPSDFKYVKVSQHLLDQLQYNAHSTGNEISNIYAANSLQQGFIYHSLSQKEDLAYKQQYLFEYHEPLEVDAYVKAMELCISQYPILRTAFDWQEELLQIVYQYGSLYHKFHDLCHLPTQDGKRDAIEQIRVQARESDFDLSKPTAFRLHIIKQSDNVYTVIKTIHHIITEGWSEAILLKQLHRYYKTIIAGGEVSVKEDSTYLEAQEYISGKKSSLMSYWGEQLNKLEGANDLTPLLSEPIDIRSFRRVEEAKTSPLVIKGRLYDQLKSFSQEHGVTLNVIVQFIWHKLIQKYSGLNRTVVGTIVSGRNLPILGIENSVGLYINTLPLIVHWEKEVSILEMLHEIQNQLSELTMHSYADLADLQRGGERIFHSLFVFENFPETEKGGIDFRLNRHYHDGIDYPLCIQAFDRADQFTINLKYDGSCLSEEKANNHIQTLAHLLNQVINHPKQEHTKLEILLPSTYDQIVNEWNKTDMPYPREKTIHEMFEEQVIRNPENIALIFEGETLTYQQLNERTNQLARHLRKEYKKRAKKGLTADSLIPLFLDRGLEMIIGILGVLKAGGAYVPIDTAYPQARIDYLLEDTEAHLVLTTAQHFSKDETAVLPINKVLQIDLKERFYETESGARLSPTSTSQDLAYIIYTSGTTGKPKGVMLEHFSLCNRVQHIISYSRIKSSDVHLFKTNYVFDASFFEVFAHLLVGASIQVTKSLFDLEELNSLLGSGEITSLHLVPSQFELIASTINRAKPDRVFFSGEALTTKILRELDETIAVYNYYGPTELGEITGFSPQAPEDAAVIGKIFPNCRQYVLDDTRKPVPVGVIGELYVGGAGLARGYLKNHTLTQDRFVANPFGTESDQAKGYTKLYRTGDLVRCLPDGRLEYVGRNDDQIKIRGMRVELGEVEEVLSGLEGISQCFVSFKQQKTAAGDSKYLIAYYTLVDVKVEISKKDVRNYLANILPDHMIPDVLIRVDRFHLTKNGKLDRSVLPEPDLTMSEEDYIAPVTEMEMIGCGIWEKVLNLTRVGVTDDFFRIGGNSISAILVANQMSQTTGFDVRVADIFKYKTLLQLLSHAVGQDKIAIPKTKENHAVLSFSQERLWFIEQFEEGTNVYHLPWVLELSEAVHIEGMCYALEKIVLRHEVLRSTIQIGCDQLGIQVIHNEPINFEVVDVKPEEKLEELIKSDVGRPFDLRKEYPLRIKFYKEFTGRVALLLNFHHIACDGWSIDVFRTELHAYYEAYLHEKTDFSLPPLAIQYKDYATWQRTYLTGEVLERQINYWKEKLTGHETLALPTDYVRPSQVDYKGASEFFEIGKATSDKLRLLAKDHGTTMHSVLLSSLYILLSKYTGQQDVVVGSPIANRHYHQTEELIGLFVNTQVNRVRLDANQSYAALIDAVHQEQVASQSHQDLPFEKLVDELGIDRDLSRHPIFQVMFGVQSFGRKKDVEKVYFKPIESLILNEISKFDLSLFIDDGTEILSGRLTYSTSLFKQSTISRMVIHYQHLLNQLVSFPEQPYSQISLLDPTEYQKIIFDWNATQKVYPRNNTIHELFQIQAAKTPDLTAIVFEGAELSYLELDQKSNQLARYIKSQYEKRRSEPLLPDTLIGLCLERSFEMIVGVLSVLKSGGTCVPINPQDPQERIDYILEDTQAALILTQEHLLESHQLLLPDDKTLMIDLNLDLFQQQDSSTLPIESTPNDLAYIVYTSGTTGKPKGVMLEHGGIVNKLSWMRSKYELTADDIVLHKSPYTFDVSIWEMLLANTCGAKLVISKPGGHLECPYLYQLIKANEVTLVHFVPSMLEVFNDYLLETGERWCTSLKHIVCSGEVLTNQLVQLTLKNVESSKLRIYNQYGPTEASITYQEVGLDEEINIGRPIQNTEVYVLDSAKLPVPVGVMGELYIGGVGLARGYYNNEELTSDFFVPNPFTFSSEEEKKSRIYRTGDLVRWVGDGQLEYLGRNDDQVKIRGNRVELGEVEHTLSAMDGVRKSCVVIKDRETTAGTVKCMVGYYEPDSESDSLEQDLLIKKMRAFLPDHMIPDVLIKLDTFPVTGNGKLDKKALPDLDSGVPDHEYVAPTTETEQMICKIWEEVLGLQRVGITDNFFKIGGNSILAIQLSHRMSKALNHEIKVADVFMNSTIRELVSAHFDRKNEFDFGVI